MKDKKHGVVPCHPTGGCPGPFRKEKLCTDQTEPVRKSQVETWTVRPSIETPDQEEKIPEKKRNH